MKKHVWYEDLDNVTCCPHCRRQIDVYYRAAFDSLEPYEPRFCPECGQELDWTEALPYGTEEERWRREAESDGNGNMRW